MWLGISGVGYWVSVSALALILNLPDRLGERLPPGPVADVMVLAAALAFYVAVQLLFDVLGGWTLPRRFGRATLRRKPYAVALARGIGAHAGLLVGCACLLYAGGSLGGVWGAWIAGLVALAGLAAFREYIAQAVARLTTMMGSPLTREPKRFTTLRVDSRDEGFTGGIAGVLRPQRSLVPAAWQEQLASAHNELITTRRDLIARCGAWEAGRCVAMGFTAVGLLMATLLAGTEDAGTGVGVLETSLWFTLWAFLGLLTLPTVSRAAALGIDHRLRQRGVDPSLLVELAYRLDALQEGEPQRPPWIERIFHPVPSVSNRRGASRSPAVCFWDVARTSVYLGIAGLSLITRSVHCNVGRPERWVWLPCD